MTLQEIKF